MNNLNEQIQEILTNLEKQGVRKIIAFSGGADESLERKVLEVTEQSMHEFKQYPIAVLTGGTK